MYVSTFADNNSSQSLKPLNSILKNTLCAFIRSQILFVAVRLNLFSIIDESPTKSLSYEELKSYRISLNTLTYLVYLRLLKRCSISQRYECTSVTRTYLVTSRENYVGPGLAVWDCRRQYTFFLRLHETLKYGIRTSEDASEQTTLWSILEQKHDPMIFFARIMSSFTRCTITELCQYVDFSLYKMLLDIGGSLGDLSRTIIRHYPHIKAISFDLPELTNYALSLTTDHSNVKYVAGNFFEEKWSNEILDNLQYIDLISLKYILHDWTYKQRQLLVGKIFQLLKNKIEKHGGTGTLLVVEKMIDPNRQNLTALSTSVSMAIECGDGIGYDATQIEYEQLLIDAGFRRIQAVYLSGPIVALFAHVI